MIVCSCNVFSDHDVRSVVGTPEPPRTAGQVYGCLGCSAQCGRCARTIKRIMDEALAGAAEAAAAGCDGCAERPPPALKLRRRAFSTALAKLSMHS